MNEQIQKNLEAKKKIEEDSDNPQKMRDVKPILLASLFNVCGGGCIGCFGWVTEPNLSYVEYNVERVLCWGCQHEKIENEERKYGEEKL